MGVINYGNQPSNSSCDTANLIMWVDFVNMVQQRINLEQSPLIVEPEGKVWVCVCVCTYGLLKGKQDSVSLVQKGLGSIPKPLESC